MPMDSLVLCSMDFSSAHSLEISHSLEVDTDLEMVLSFSDMEAVAVLGRNKLNIYHDKQVYQFKGSKRFNALKYVHLYHRYKNLERGNADAKFLGL